MAERDKLNAISGAYQKRLQDPDWRVGSKKDLEQFSKGARGEADVESPGTKAVKGIGTRVKNAWKALTD